MTGRYDSHVNPFSWRMNRWGIRRVNDNRERQTKGIPCHITKIDKDFLWVAFEPQNNIFTPPTVKIPSAQTLYHRLPHQVGDQGVAAPGDYYQGGVTGDAGGKTDFYPRGNLTALAFHGTSQTGSPNRYGSYQNKLEHMGGPEGWIVGTYQKHQQEQQQQNGSQQGTQTESSPAVGTATTVRLRNGSTLNIRQRKIQVAGQPIRLRGIQPPAVQVLDTSTPSSSGTNGSSQSNQSSQGQNQNKTWFQFDKNNRAEVQSYDTNHIMAVDQQNKTVSMDSSQTIYTDPHGGIHYVGGNPNKHKHCKIMTECGPSPYAWARIG